MKKKYLTVAFVLACTLSLSACGGNTASASQASAPVASASASVSEENKTQASASEADNSSASDPASSTEADIEGFNINGVWQNDKIGDTWIVIENYGNDWTLYNFMGEVAVKGHVELDGDGFALIDEFGDKYTTISILEDTSIFDEDLQESYSKVEALPEKFPGAVAAEIGFEAIAGSWFYQQSPADNTSDYSTVAYVDILSDGTYRITWLDDLSERTGIIMVQTGENPDGSQVVYYEFFEGGNNRWITAEVSSEDPEVLIVDQQGTERMILNIGEGD